MLPSFLPPMWENLREDVELLFAALSRSHWGAYLRLREQRALVEKARRGYQSELRCQECGKYINGSFVRSGTKWCSNRCKQRNKNRGKRDAKNDKARRSKGTGKGEQSS